MIYECCFSGIIQLNFQEVQVDLGAWDSSSPFEFSCIPQFTTKITTLLLMVLGITKVLFHLLQARKALRRLKGILRLQILTQSYPVQKQSTTTLNLLHSWCKLQTQVRARRLCMVTEGRIKQKKLENQQKLEAKLHDIEVTSLASLQLSWLKSL